jgi:hypothetical protein
MSYAEPFGFDPFPTSPMPQAPRTVFPAVMNMNAGVNPNSNFPDLSSQVILDFDGWRKTLPPAPRAAVDGQLARSFDAAAQAMITKRMQTDIWLSERTGWPLDFINNNRDAVISAYGTANNIPDWDNADKLHAFIKTQAQKDYDEHVGVSGSAEDTEEGKKLRKASLMEFALTAARETGAKPQAGDKQLNESRSWEEYQAKAKTEKWWRPENVDTYHRQFHGWYQQGQREVAKAEVIFDKLKPILTEAAVKGKESAKKAYGTAAMTGDEPQFEEAVHLMRQLSPIEKRLVLERLAAWKPGKEGDRALDEDISASSTRGLTALKQSVIDQMEKLAYGLARSPKAPGRTRQEIDEEQNLRSQLVNATLGKLDPVDQSSWWRFSLTSAAESSGVMLTAAIPVAGPALLIAGYSSDAENKMVAAGVPVNSARNMSYIIGPMQAAVDMVQLKLFKQLGMGRLFSGITAKAAGAFGVRVAGTTITESVIEIGQDVLVPAVVQEVASWWGQNIPGIKWADVADEAWAQAPDVLLTMLPIAALAGGAAHMSDVKNAKALISDPERLTLLGYQAADMAKIQAAATDNAALKAFREGWAKRTPVMAGDYKGAGISEGAQAIQAEIDQKSETGALEIPVDTQGAINSLTEPESPGALDPLAEAFPLTRDDNGWFIMDGASRTDFGTDFSAAKYAQNQLRMATTEKVAQAWLDVAGEITGRGLASTVTLTGESVGMERGPEGTTVTAYSAANPKAEAVTFSQASLQNLDAEMEAAGITTGSIQGSNELIRDTLGKVNVAIKANIGPEGILTLIHEAAEGQFRLGKVTKAETQAAAQALLPVFAHDTQITGELQAIAGGNTTSAAARETMMGILVSNELGQRKDKRRFKPGAITAGFMDALKMQGGAEAQAGPKKYLAMARAIGKYFKTLFSGMKALAKARKGGADLKDFDAFADKLLGIDPDKKAAVASAKEAAGMAEKTTGESLFDLEHMRGWARREGATGGIDGDASFSIARDAAEEQAPAEVEIHTLSKGEITLAKKPATKELLRELSKQEGMYKQLIDCLKK